MKSFAEPINKLLVPLTSAVGSTLQDAWELVFGGFGTYVDKQRARRLHDLTEFKDSLESKVAAIPEERLTEPALAIVGPALDASKYYFEEPELREMFANLISASMDSEKASSVQPCFTEIIKQLSPLDAQNLVCFRNDPSLNGLPLAEYRLVLKETGNYKILQTNIFLSNPSAPSIPTQAVSIAALSRLGLVDITYLSSFVNDVIYEPFSKTELYRFCEQEVSKRSDGELKIARGMARLTPLGKAFIDICFPSD